MGSEAFEKLCKERGVTPYRVAKETGVTTATLSSWKTGKYTPKTEKLQKLADYFGVNVSVFNSATVQTDVQTDTYYKDAMSAIIAQQMFEDEEIHGLFHIKKNIPADRFKAFYDMITAYYKMEHPDDTYIFDKREFTYGHEDE